MTWIVSCKKKEWFKGSYRLQSALDRIRVDSALSGFLFLQTSNVVVVPPGCLDL